MLEVRAADLIVVVALLMGRAFDRLLDHMAHRKLQRKYDEQHADLQLAVTVALQLTNKLAQDKLKDTNG